MGDFGKKSRALRTVLLVTVFAAAALAPGGTSALAQEAVLYGGHHPDRRLYRLNIATGAMVDLGALDGHFSEAFGINDVGQVVGESGGRAFVYDDGAMRDLNTLLPADSGWVLRSAQDVNNLGQIVGWGTAPDGIGPRAFLLTPVPEPGHIALLGLCGLATLRRRR